MLDKIVLPPVMWGLLHYEERNMQGIINPTKVICMGKIMNILTTYIYRLTLVCFVRGMGYVLYFSTLSRWR